MLTMAESSIHILAKNYRIRPNYRTVRIGFSKLLGKLVVKYDSTY